MNINGLNYLLNKQFDFFRKKISESIGPFFCPWHSAHAWVTSGSIHPSLFDMHYLKEEEERKIYPYIPTPARQKGEKGAGCHPAQQQQRHST
jgi:hypothetical protein